MTGFFALFGGYDDTVENKAGSQIFLYGKKEVSIKRFFLSLPIVCICQSMIGQTRAK
jgi:hypothetical protein